MKETSADCWVHQGEDNFAIRVIERFPLIDMKKELISAKEPHCVFGAQESLFQSQICFPR